MTDPEFDAAAFFERELTYPLGQDEIPDWIAQVSARAELTEREQKLLARLMPDGSRGTLQVLRAVAQFRGRNGMDTAMLDRLLTKLKEVPYPQFSEQPLMSVQPLSHFLVYAASLPENLDLWSLTAMPALWEARATKSGDERRRAKRITQVYHRAHAVRVFLEALSELLKARPGFVEDLVFILFWGRAPELHASRVPLIEGVFSAAKLEASDRVADCVVRVYDRSDLRRYGDQELMPVSAIRRAGTRTVTPTPGKVSPGVGTRRNINDGLSTAGILGHTDLPRLTPLLSFRLLAWMVTQARKVLFGVDHPSLRSLERQARYRVALKALLWILLTGQNSANACQSNACGLKARAFADADRWINYSGRLLKWGRRLHLSDLALLGRQMLQHSGSTPDEVAQLSGVLLPKVAVNLKHYLRIGFESPDAQARLVAHFDAISHGINRFLPPDAQLQMNDLVGRDVFLAWASKSGTDVIQPDQAKVQEVGRALSRALASVSDDDPPERVDQVNRAAALFCCLVVLGIRSKEELPFLRTSNFNQICQRIALSKTKAYAEGRVLPYPPSLQRFFSAFVHDRRVLGFQPYLFAPWDAAYQPPSVGMMRQQLYEVARQHGYDGTAISLALYRRAALQALYQKARGSRMGWILKASLEGHSIWLMSRVCDMPWSAVQHQFDAFWAARLEEVGLNEPTKAAIRDAA